ncbi:MAG: DUF2948 family protein [Rhodobacteraceae bacterium]|nr:DUF2948 family protein [Paracoccaceae bacterium]
MTEDARFEDGAEWPLHLKAETPEDLTVVSALVQDSVLTAADMRWEPKARRLSFLLNRFRWEDHSGDKPGRHGPERVRSLLIIGDVGKVSSQGIDRNDPDTVLSILALNWQAGADCAGRVELILAGDGAIAAEVECLEITLKDVTRPYAAPSRKMPAHPE